MNARSVGDSQLLAALRRNCRRYKAELDELKRSRGDGRAITALSAKLSEAEESIRSIERNPVGAPGRTKSKKRRLASRIIDQPIRFNKDDVNVSPICRTGTLTRLCDIAGKLRRNVPLNGSGEARVRGLCRRTLVRDIRALRLMGWKIDFDNQEKTYVLRFAPPPKYF